MNRTDKYCKKCELGYETRCETYDCYINPYPKIWTELMHRHFDNLLREKCRYSLERILDEE